MKGYNAIREVEKEFLMTGRGWDYYTSYIDMGDEDGEICISDAVRNALDGIAEITDFTYESERFDGGPGYEATVYFFAWIEDGELKTDRILTECM